MTEKNCPACNQVKPLTEFYRAGGKNKYQSLCKPCHNARRCKLYHETKTIKPRLNAWEKQPEEIAVPERLRNGEKLTKICRDMNLPYENFSYYRKAGLMPI